MRARLEAELERWLPGMGLRPFLISCIGVLLLALYHTRGGRSDMPHAWLEWWQAFSGIQNKGFHRHGFSHFMALVLLMLIPLAYARLVDGMGPRELGLRLRGTLKEFGLVIVLWLVFIPGIYWASTQDSFQNMYPRLKAAETDVTIFVLYQAFYLVKWTAWEFFFRGFLLFGLEKDLGARAVLVSTLPFVIVHMGKPELEMLGSLPAGIILCVIALKSRSIWPGVFIHSMVATTMDFFAAQWW